MFIVEGPDGAGKTTLAKRIASEFDMKYMRYPRLSSEEGPPRDQGIWDWWSGMLASYETDWMVFDRCAYISEIPYQLVMRGRPLVMNGDGMSYGISKVWMAEPSIIFCIPPWETSREIIRSQPQKLQGVTEEDLEKVHWAYASLYGMWIQALPDRVTWFDFTTQTDASIMNWVDERRRR